MDDRRTDKTSGVERLRARRAATIRFVLIVNAAMFVVELVSGLLVGSVALLADSLNMLGDALVVGFGLFVVGRGPVWKAQAAVTKAAVMGVFGVFVFGQLVYKILYPQLPTVEAMGGVAALALVANGVCFALLWHHRAENGKMRSIWLCSRNDIIANVAVLSAAFAVWMTLSPWPDIVVGTLICVVFLRSAWLIAREARVELGLTHADAAPRRTRRKWRIH